MVNLNDSYLYVLMEFYHIQRMGYAAIGHLRDVYQSILMHADIYKCTKVGDVGYDARQYHSLNQIVDSRHILVELECFKLLAWVATRLLELRQDICKCGHSYIGCYVAWQLDGIALVLIINKVGP